MKKDRSLHSNSLLTKSKYNKKLLYRKSNEVKHLEHLAFEAAKKKYPNVPYLAPRVFRDDSANGLTNCIIQFLRLLGHQAERISNTGRQIDNRITFEDVIGRKRTIGNSKWIPGTGTNGSADISGIIGGRSIKIEVKIGRDIQSQNQKNYQHSIEQAGGIYFIATSFEQFLTWFDSTFGEIKP